MKETNATVELPMGGITLRLHELGGGKPRLKYILKVRSEGGRQVWVLQRPGDPRGVGWVLPLAGSERQTIRVTFDVKRGRRALWREVRRAVGRQISEVVGISTEAAEVQRKARLHAVVDMPLTEEFERIVETILREGERRPYGVHRLFLSKRPEDWFPELMSVLQSRTVTLPEWLALQTFEHNPHVPPHEALRDTLWKIRIAKRYLNSMHRFLLDEKDRSALWKLRKNKVLGRKAWELTRIAEKEGIGVALRRLEIEMALLGMAEKYLNGLLEMLVPSP